MILVDLILKSLCGSGWSASRLHKIEKQQDNEAHANSGDPSDLLGIMYRDIIPEGFRDTILVQLGSYIGTFGPQHLDP